MFGGIFRFLASLVRLILRVWKWRDDTAPEREGDKIRRDVQEGNVEAVKKHIEDALRH